MKILIIRFSSIGDIVLTTPVIRCLYKQLNVEIHYITKSSFRGILEQNPYITKVWSIEKRVSEVSAKLRQERFDYIIDLHKNLRSFQLKVLFRCPSFSFDKLNFQKWLLVKLHINILPTVHIVDRYMQAVAPLGVHNDQQGLDYFISENDIQNAQQIIDNQNITNNNFIAFAIGAAHATKRLPDNQIIAICKKICIPVVLLGGKEDAQRGELIATQTGTYVINLCGQLSLNLSAAMVALCQKIITHDTGLMHIAAALRKPIISIWGSTVPAFGMYPYLPNGEPFQIIEVQKLSCRPCSKIGYDVCPKGHFKCMNEIAADEVAGAATLL